MVAKRYEGCRQPLPDGWAPGRVLESVFRAGFQTGFGTWLSRLLSKADENCLGTPVAAGSRWVQSWGHGC